MLVWKFHLLQMRNILWDLVLINVISFFVLRSLKVMGLTQKLNVSFWISIDLQNLLLNVFVFWSKTWHSDYFMFDQISLSLIFVLYSKGVWISGDWSVSSCTIWIMFWNNDSLLSRWSVNNLNLLLVDVFLKMLINDWFYRIWF